MHCICSVQLIHWNSIHIIILNRVFLVISMCSVYASQMLIMMIAEDWWVHYINDNWIIKVSLKVQRHFFCCQYVSICSECVRKKYAGNVLESSHRHAMMNDVDDVMLWWDWDVLFTWNICNTYDHIITNSFLCSAYITYQFHISNCRFYF